MKRATTLACGSSTVLARPYTLKRRRQTVSTRYVA